MMWAVVQRDTNLLWGRARFLPGEPSEGDLETFANQCTYVGLGPLKIEVFKVEPAGRYTAEPRAAFEIARVE